MMGLPAVVVIAIDAADLGTLHDGSEDEATGKEIVDSYVTAEMKETVEMIRRKTIAVVEEEAEANAEDVGT